MAVPYQGAVESRRPWMPKFLSGDHPFPWLAPMFAMIIAFGIYPLIYSIWLSTQGKVPGLRDYKFIGAENWIKAFSDDRFIDSLVVTIEYTLICLVIQVVLGMAIAMLLDCERRGYGLLRALMTLPLVVQPAVTGMMFLLMEDGQFGVLSYYLKEMGLVDPDNPILASTSMALWGVMAADIWQWTPFMVLILMAGLRALPKEPFEAAAIDGANWWQTLRHLTLPMLSRVIATAVLIRTIDLYRIYDYIFAMTSGGPGTATETLSFYAGRVFGVANFPYAATLSLLTLIMLNVICFAFIKIFRVKF